MQIGTLGRAQAGFEATFEKLQALKQLKIERTRQELSDLTSATDDLNWQMTATDGQRSLALEQMNARRRTLNLPELTELADKVTPSFMADFAELRTQTKIDPATRALLLAEKYGQGNWLTKNLVRFKDQLTLQTGQPVTTLTPDVEKLVDRPALPASEVMDQSGRVISGDVDANATKLELLPDKGQTQGAVQPMPDDGTATAAAITPLQNPMKSPEDELAGLFSTTWQPPLTTDEAMDERNKLWTFVAQTHQGSPDLPADQTLPTRKKIFELEKQAGLRPQTDVFDPTYLANLGRGLTTKEKEKKAAEHAKMFNEAWNRVTKEKADPGAEYSGLLSRGVPEAMTYGILQAKPGGKVESSINNARAADFQQLAEQTYRELTDLYNSNAPRDADFDKQSHYLRFKLWQQESIAQNPSLTFKDLPESAMPKNYGLNKGTMTNAQQRSGDQRDRALDQGDRRLDQGQQRIDKQGGAGTGTGGTWMDEPDTAAKAAALTAAEKTKYGPFFSTAAMTHAPKSVRTLGTRYMRKTRAKGWIVLKGGQAEFKKVSDREDALHVHKGTGQQPGGGKPASSYTGPTACSDFVKDASGYHGSLGTLKNGGTGTNAEIRKGVRYAVHTNEGRGRTHWVYVDGEGVVHDVWGNEFRERTIDQIRPHIMEVKRLPGQPVKAAPAAQTVSTKQKKDILEEFN